MERVDFISVLNQPFFAATSVNMFFCMFSLGLYPRFLPPFANAETTDWTQKNKAKPALAFWALFKVKPDSKTLYEPLRYWSISISSGNKLLQYVKMFLKDHKRG